jgi:hypothetical protein
LFSRDTFLPLVLVVPLIYHQTTPKPPPKTSSITGTRSLDLVGSGVASFIQRRTTDADHHPRPMTNATMQVVINGNTIEGTASQIAQIIGNFSDVMVQPVAPVTITQEEKSVKFVEFFGATLESHIKGGKLFVSELNKLRHQGNDYRAMIRLYHDLVNAPTKGWAKRRQLLLTTSAIWRYTFKTKKGGLKYKIAAVTECDDCGEFAKAMVNRMIAEKLWV